MKIVYHDRFLDHRQRNEEHPERPERLVAIRDRLHAEGLWENIVTPEPAPMEDILRVHMPNYVDRIAAMGEGEWDHDTYVRPETIEIAKLAAGAGILAADLAWEGRETAWALVRPPGHHATAGSAMGFCYLNSTAIAAARHIELGRGRVAVVDVDVHHGNGTQEIFYNRADVLMISIHEWPLFPGTGSTLETGIGQGNRHTINMPVPAGSGDEAYMQAIERVITPALRRWRPSIMLISYGTDIHYLDPLAALNVTSAGCVEIAARLEALAREVCEGRIAFLLEGGYHLEALAESVAGAIGRSVGRSVSLEHVTPRHRKPIGVGIVDVMADMVQTGFLAPAPK